MYAAVTGGVAEPRAIIYESMAALVGCSGAVMTLFAGRRASAQHAPARGDITCWTQAREMASYIALRGPPRAAFAELRWRAAPRAV